MIRFELFAKCVTVITGVEADRIRQEYVARFVDTSSQYYREFVGVTKRYRDGVYYSGYLWDSLKHFKQIPERQILDNGEMLDAVVFVLWDLHSSEKIRIQDYWRFPKSAVLKMRWVDLLAGQAYLPEDIYIFDDSFTWSFV